MNQKLNHPILEQIKENDGTRRRIIRKEKEKTPTLTKHCIKHTQGNKLII